MRHHFAGVAAGAIPRLTGRVPKATRPAALILPAGRSERGAPRAGGTRAGAIPLPAIADAAEEEQLLTLWSAADDQPEGIHAPPRSSRGGWTSSGSYASKEAARRALPRCDPPRGLGVCQTPGPHPLRRRRDRSTSSHAVQQPPAETCRDVRAFSCPSTQRQARARRRHGTRCRAPRRGWTLAVSDRQSSWDGGATARLTRVRHDSSRPEIDRAICTPEGGERDRKGGRERP